MSPAGGAGPGYDVIVLAGGQARRLGGADKPALEMSGRSLLDHVLAGCAGAQLRIVVGPRRPCRHHVVWCREEPPGGGPVAGLTAGMRYVRQDLVLVLAADMPFVGAAVPALLASSAGHDGAVLLDASGREQPLAAAYRRAALAARIEAHGSGHGVSMRQLLTGLDLVRTPDVAGAAMDCDTWADLDRAREAANEREAASEREDRNRAR